MVAKLSGCTAYAHPSGVWQINCQASATDGNHVPLSAGLLSCSATTEPERLALKFAHVSKTPLVGILGPASSEIKDAHQSSLFRLAVQQQQPPTGLQPMSSGSFHQQCVPSGSFHQQCAQQYSAAPSINSVFSDTQLLFPGTSIAQQLDMAPLQDA